MVSDIRGHGGMSGFPDRSRAQKVDWRGQSDKYDVRQTVGMEEASGFSGFIDTQGPASSGCTIKIDKGEACPYSTEYTVYKAGDAGCFLRT
jgi:hypothetical protein